MLRIVLLSLGVFLLGCVEGARTPEQPSEPTPDICGKWSSVTSGKTYDFRCHEGGAFDVYEVKDIEARPIGKGLQIGQSVTAKIDVDLGGQSRPALMKLQAQGADELVGIFIGRERIEEGNIRLVRSR